ncbi:glucose 1-dehydrogenase [Vulcanimicrobium alpinum]|uniref:glucose 1-dehydrogenase n=1 Tax=Vulcanimicrobium alpinum TaxID=3016050 RepID=UPI00295ED687|nr:glucose 1-dehydrogenase [Vulcanimicrobium alpinum]
MQKETRIHMQAVAVSRNGSSGVALIDVAPPRLDEIPGGRGVLVRVVRVGVDGTDKEILAGEYGKPPPGETFLITGHESFGVVEAVGPNVHELAPGDLVVATVRRRGSSPYDAIGTYDMTTDDDYIERGINLRHGFLAEYYVDDPEYTVRVPPELRDVGVLLEPTSVVEKGIAQAYEIQRRLRIWKPRTAFVLGAGTIGLLAAMVLRLRGLDVHVFARDEAPNRNAALVAALGATYHATASVPFAQAAQSLAPADIIFEATGYSPFVFDAMDVLGKNGVLVLSSVTGGSRTVEVPADRINLGFVLGNKVVVGTVNANREYFELGVRDHALAVATWGDWALRLITHRVSGLAQHAELLDLLTHGTGTIKVVCEVSALA